MPGATGAVTASDVTKKGPDESAAPVSAILEQIDGLDGESRAALAADLEKVPPSLRPLVLSQLEAVAKRDRKDKPAREDQSPSLTPSSRTPHSQPFVSHDRQQEDRQMKPAKEEHREGMKQAACVECEDRVVSAGATVVSSRTTSPFDRLASLARAEENKRTADSRSATDLRNVTDSRNTVNNEEQGNAVVANQGTANQGTANQGTAIQRTARPASYALKSEGSRSWQGALEEAIEKLEAASPSEACSPDEIADLARLRLLQLAAGRRSEALTPVPSLSAEADAFFTKTLFGIDVWLDNRRIADEDRRAAAALPHLTEAIGHLGEVAPLSVRNLQLCTAVNSYGVVEPFKTGSFRPGQEVLVYAEVENFHSKETAEGFETILEGRVLIFDSRGHRVGEIDLPKKEDRCNRRRRDFFVVYQVQLPERLYPGSHSLKLTIEDAGRHKIGQSTLKFAVSDEGEHESE